MESATVVTPGQFAPARTRPRYGVGVRVLTDRRLVAQIREDIFRNVLRPEQVAALENVTPDVLIGVLASDAAAPLREFAASRADFQVRAWQTTRKHPSKLHIVDARGVALCGTSPGTCRSVIDDGPCLTCAARANVQLSVEAA